MSSVRVMCPALNISVSGYYAWRSRPESARVGANRALVENIRCVQANSRRRYGSSTGACVATSRMTTFAGQPWNEPSRDGIWPWIMIET